MLGLEKYNTSFEIFTVFLSKNLKNKVTKLVFKTYIQPVRKFLEIIKVSLLLNDVFVLQQTKNKRGHILISPNMMKILGFTKNNIFLYNQIQVLKKK